MVNVKGKNILVFYPKGATAHYGESIIKELRKQGASVRSYDERPSQSPVVKIVTRLAKKRLPQYFNNYIKKIISKNQHVNFDYVLVLRGEAFVASTVALLRNAYPSAKMILYLWDVLQSNDLSSIITLFDKALSFDPQDAKDQASKKLIFRPTFSLDEFYEVGSSSQQLHSDVFFVGTLRPERYISLSKIKKQLELYNYKVDFYFYIPGFVLYLKDKLTDKKYAEYNEVNFFPMPVDDIVKHVAQTKAVLDLRYKSQVSLSMRAFETLAAKKKYITNNPNIKSYDFYNSTNILLIDESNPIIPVDFIESEFQDLPQNIYKKYSVESWVEDVFNGV